jgi:hypothetical protein
MYILYCCSRETGDPEYQTIGSGVKASFVQGTFLMFLEKCSDLYAVFLFSIVSYLIGSNLVVFLKSRETLIFTG